jgi:hypothetical protein
MVGVFQRRPLDLYGGGIQRGGEFLEDLGEIGEYPLGGSFLTLKALDFLDRLEGLLRRTRDKVAQSFSFFIRPVIPASVAESRERYLAAHGSCAL